MTRPTSLSVGDARAAIVHEQLLAHPELERVEDIAGLPRLAVWPMTPHAARHTFASYLIATGKLTPKQVQEYVGHTDIRTTYNVYGHLLPGDEDTAREALDGFLDAGAAR